MSVRAKFTVAKIERFVASGNEMQTITLTPVYGNGDPEHENSKFWKYTPSGEIKLGTINLDAAAQFELGAEFYIDFTRAK